MKYTKIILLIFTLTSLFSCKKNSLEILQKYESRVTELSDNKQYEEALFLCDKMEKINSDFLSIYLYRGIIFMYIEQFENAELEFTNILEKNEHINFFLPRQLITTYAWRSTSRMKQRKYELAKSDAKKCIALYDDDSKGYQSLATIYYENKEYENTLKVLDIMISKFPNVVGIYYMRAKIYYCLQNYELSISDCNKDINIDQNKITFTLYLRGLSYIALEKYKEALLDLIKIQEEYPEESWIYYSLAYTYFKLGDIEKAKQNHITATETTINDTLTKVSRITQEFIEKIEVKEVFKEIIEMLEKVSE